MCGAEPLDLSLFSTVVAPRNEFQQPAVLKSPLLRRPTSLDARPIIFLLRDAQPSRPYP